MSSIPPLETHLQCLVHWDYRVQRCDAQQPCTACVQLDGGSECTYDQSRAMKRTREKLPADAQPFLFSFKYAPNPRESSSSWAASEDTGLPAFDMSSPESGSSGSPSTCSTSPQVSPEKPPFVEPDTPGSLDPPTPQQGSPGMQLVPFGGDSPEPLHLEMTTLSSLPFLQSPSIPRPLYMPFCPMNPEYFQISDTTSSELDLSL